MDVAQQLATWRAQTPDQWLRSANRYLPPVVTALLVVLIAYQAKTLTWRLLDSQTVSQPLTPIANTNRSQPVTQTSLDARMLADLHLLGVASREPAPVAPPTENAPVTNLPLRLTALRLATDGIPSMATIVSNNRDEKVYLVGDTIEGASGTTLQDVRIDAAILNVNGRIERLPFPKTEGTTMGSSPRSAATTQLSLNRQPQVRPVAAQPAQQLITSENSQRIAQIVRFAPHIEQGKVIGIRVTPNQDSEIFESLGFQSGDVVTQINGTVLDDVTDGLQAIESLAESTTANVTVIREGSSQVLVIDTSQLQSVLENRQ